MPWPHSLGGDRQRVPGLDQRDRLVQRRNLAGQLEVGKAKGINRRRLDPMARL
jgi:hypothetical protein